MELRNCRRCGKVFAYVNNPLCPKCVEVEEEEFKLVREYVASHDKPTVQETAEATGVDEKQILKFLREGRLLKAGCKWSVLACESCGKPIPGGRFCDECANSLAQQFSDAVNAKGEAAKNWTREKPAWGEVRGRER